ncbi:hypothetical protein IMSHALPRED_008123 [Imshaugia aleurites]|uniref:Uncharacterized protein n=1 Tax=Imshaugia aleurites TaxID=172621 RepID=A0A8H3IJE2_9LECA|nr:hypothetical protein IMSHALPRED_008123 [Imshaugia aleurites]
MPPSTPYRQTSSSASDAPSPSTDQTSIFSALAVTSIDFIYQIVQIKPTGSDWVTPSPTDHIQITCRVPRDKPQEPDDDEEACEDEDSAIPCAACLVWGGRSINLTCLYLPAALLFTDFEGCRDETANGTDRRDRVESLGFGLETGGGTVLDEDMRDDNGTPFLVLHVIGELHGSARLYCKRVLNR